MESFGNEKNKKEKNYSTMSCLFNALAHFLPESGSTIRQKICDYLVQNEKLMDGLDTQFILSLDGSAEAYLTEMRKSSTWGGAIEIQAACNIWNLEVTVRNLRDPIPTTIVFQPFQPFPLPLKPFREIELEWTGGHYEPVRQ
jgi:hypothetical protein